MVRVDPKLLSSTSSIRRAPIYLILAVLIGFVLGFPSLRAFTVGLDLQIHSQSSEEEVVVISLNEVAPARGIFGTLVALTVDGNRRILFKQIPVGSSRGKVATFRMTSAEKDLVQLLVNEGAKFEFFPAPVELHHETDRLSIEDANPTAESNPVA